MYLIFVVSKTFIKVLRQRFLFKLKTTINLFAQHTPVVQCKETTFQFKVGIDSSQILSIKVEISQGLRDMS